MTGEHLALWLITVRDIYPLDPNVSCRPNSAYRRRAVTSGEICKIRLRLGARWPQNYGGWSVGFMKASLAAFLMDQSVGVAARNDEPLDAQ
jgi:hypothetical protein